jgi:hypothetical protein
MKQQSKASLVLALFCATALCTGLFAPGDEAHAVNNAKRADCTCVYPNGSEDGCTTCPSGQNCTGCIGSATCCDDMDATD